MTVAPFPCRNLVDHFVTITPVGRTLMRSGRGVRRLLPEGSWESARAACRAMTFSISTKLAAEIKDHDGAMAAIEESLAKLDIGYIDLMLIHSPQPRNDFRGGRLLRRQRPSVAGAGHGDSPSVARRRWTPRKRRWPDGCRCGRQAHAGASASDEGDAVAEVVGGFTIGALRIVEGVLV